MALYETVFIARQDITSAQAEQLAETFTQLLRDNGGEVKKTEHWGLKNLAYRMNKNRKGHYVLFNIDAPHPAVAEMERNMRLNEDVLRYMTIRVDELEEGPSAVMQNRDRGGERGDRGDRGDRGGMGRGPRPRRDDRDDRPEGEFVSEGVTE
jgi:small subunit ribosomal protein S6